MGRGFRNPTMASEFDAEIRTKVTHWCCRSPADQKKLKLPDKIQLEILPPSRRGLIPNLKKLNYFFQPIGEAAAAGAGAGAS